MMKKSSTHSTPCGNCTKCYTPGREHCPAKDSTCHSCQKIGHWKQKCRKSSKAKDAHKKPKSQPQWWHGGRRRADEVGVSEGYPAFDEVMIHAWLADQKRPEDLEKITLTDISIDAMTEAFATVDMPVASEKRASLQCKVDTGAGGNVMPLWAFAKLFPNRLTKSGMPAGLWICNTKLRAYNRTNIPQLSALETTITWKDEETKKVNKMETTFYVADTPGPAILGLPSCSRLRIVNLNCSVQLRKHGQPVKVCKEREKVKQDMKNLKPINSKDDLIKAYPDWFEEIGKFPGTYHIYLKEDAIPVVHRPRKCPIAIWPLVDKKLDKLLEQEVTVPVTEPMDWVSSLAYSWKADGNLRTCLNPTHHFNMKKPVKIQVNASSKGLGATLIQDDGPVTFASKVLTPTEQCYANNERELLACIFGAECFWTYVFGRHFMIESDHKSLEQISMKNLADRQCVYWPGVNKDIKQLVEACATCQRHQPKEPRQPLKPTLPHEWPWQQLGADFMMFDGSEYLVIVYYYSKMPIVWKMPTSQCDSAKTITVLKELFAEHGIPEEIQSDNRP